MKIALCIGHNEEKQGAIGSEGISEWDFNRAFVGELLEEIDNSTHSFKVFHRLPFESYTKQMTKLHSELNDWDTELAISFHFNGSIDASVNGHEVLCCSPNGATYANKLNDLFNNYLDNNNRGVKRREIDDRGGQFLCKGHYPCIMAEPFFGKYQYRYVKGGIRREALVQAYIDFFNNLI